MTFIFYRFQSRKFFRGLFIIEYIGKITGEIYGSLLPWCCVTTKRNSCDPYKKKICNIKDSGHWLLKYLSTEYWMSNTVNIYRDKINSNIKIGLHILFGEKKKKKNPINVCHHTCTCRASAKHLIHCKTYWVERETL